MARSSTKQSTKSSNDLLLSDNEKRLLIARLDQELTEERRSLAEVSLEVWAREYFPDYFSDSTPDFHLELDELADAAEEQDNAGTVIAAPRGHAKSTRVSFLRPMFWALNRRKKFIVIVSDTDGQAENFLDAIKREFEENEQLREDYGDMCGSAYGYRWTNKDFTIVIPKRDPMGNVLYKNGRAVVEHSCRIVGKGTGSKLRGLRTRHQRPDAIICDDLENDEHVQTPEQRQKAWKWFTKALVPMLDPKHGTLLIIGTVLHYDSLLSKLLKMGDIYTVRTYKAILAGKASIGKGKGKGTLEGTPLWPDRFPLKKLEALKKQIGSHAFNSEYMNEPIDETTRVYKPEWFKWYTKHDMRYDRKTESWWYREEITEMAQGIDPAISEKDTACEFADVTLAFTKTNKILLMDVDNDRIDFPTQVQRVIHNYNTWVPERVGVEEVYYQTALRQQVLKEAQVPMRAIKQRKDKHSRIVAASVPVENGQLYLRKCVDGEDGYPCPWGVVDGLIHPTSYEFYLQATQYPSSALVDIIDAYANCLSMMKGTKAFGEYAGDEEEQLNG